MDSRPSFETRARRAPQDEVGDIFTSSKAGDQYAAASRLNNDWLWNTGSPGQAGRRRLRVGLSPDFAEPVIGGAFARPAGFIRAAEHTTPLCRVPSRQAMISALFEEHMEQPNALEAGGAEIRACVVAHGAARVDARRLHASDARPVVGCKLYPTGPAVAGPSALCAGRHSRVLSPAYRRLFAQRAAGHDPGRYRRALSLLRPPRRHGDPLRRGGGGGSAGLLRRSSGWPHV